MMNEKLYGLLALSIPKTKKDKNSDQESEKDTSYTEPELHLNLWEDFLGKEPTAFLDIGLKISEHEKAERFEFVFPWRVKNSDLYDLSLKVLQQNAAPAIFNEMWISTSSNGQAGIVTNSEGEAQFCVVQLHTDLKIKQYNEGNRAYCLNVVSLDIEQIKKKAMSIKDNNQKISMPIYVRFRIMNVPPDFYQVTIREKFQVMNHFSNPTHIMDFRVNVRRGIPLGFDSIINGEFLRFKKIHLFSMRNKDQEILFQDKWFKSCRSLEDEDFWADYSTSHIENLSNKDQSLHRKNVKNSLGYQWTKKESDEGSVVNEFSILARFKKTETGLKKIVFYLLLIIVIGVFTNMVYDFIKFLLGY